MNIFHESSNQWEMNSSGLVDIISGNPSFEFYLPEDARTIAIYMSMEGSLQFYLNDKLIETATRSSYATFSYNFHYVGMKKGDKATFKYSVNKSDRFRFRNIRIRNSTAGEYLFIADARDEELYLHNVGLSPNLTTNFQGKNIPTYRDKYLVKSNNSLFYFDGNDWIKNEDNLELNKIFELYGMNSLDSISKEDWERVNSEDNVSILVQSNSDTKKEVKAIISKINYDNEVKGYRGIGIIQTETENIADNLNNLWIVADQEECTFEYSLDNGETWETILPEEIVTISNQTGNELVVKVYLPNETSVLRGLAVGWA